MTDRGCVRKHFYFAELDEFNSFVSFFVFIIIHQIFQFQVLFKFTNIMLLRLNRKSTKVDSSNCENRI